MEHYKSLAEKLDLLDYALKYHDGNAITAVSYFYFFGNKCRLKFYILTKLYGKQS